MNKVEKVILWNYVVISLLVLTAAQSDFSYSNTKPDYIVGQQITSNNPLIEIDGGEFTIKPAFSKGLSLDLATGVITGTPTEEYDGEFTVTYKDSATQLTKISVLVIKGIIITFICSLG